MEKTINLPNIEAISEFVKGARESGDLVLVSKEGFKFQIDGESILGMMAVVGENIKVKCFGNADCLGSIFERYSVAK